MQRVDWLRSAKGGLGEDSMEAGERGQVWGAGEAAEAGSGCESEPMVGHFEAPSPQLKRY